MHKYVYVYMYICIYCEEYLAILSTQLSVSYDSEWSS